MIQMKDDGSKTQCALAPETGVVHIYMLLSILCYIYKVRSVIIYKKKTALKLYNIIMELKCVNIGTIIQEGDKSFKD